MPGEVYLPKDVGFVHLWPGGKEPALPLSRNAHLKPLAGHLLNKDSFTHSTVGYFCGKAVLNNPRKEIMVSVNGYVWQLGSLQEAVQT